MAQPVSLCQSISAFDNSQAGSPEDGQQTAEEDSPLFHSDDFRIWCMKVIPCTKRFVHDWTVCPFAHAGEKAVRRDPRTHNYTGIACPDMKKQSNCIRGDKCPYAHNVFEYWLHPTRYRTQLCNDGPTCKRSICFFAHSLEELRVPAVKPYVSPEALARASLDAIQQNPHPLGQQLPNPASTMRGGGPHATSPTAGQQQHQMRTSRSSSNFSPTSSFSRPANQTQQGQGMYPGQQQGFPSHAQRAQQPVRRSAPVGNSPYSGMGERPPQGPPSLAAQHQAPQTRASLGGGGYTVDGMKLSLTPSSPHWGADPHFNLPLSPAHGTFQGSPHWAPPSYDFAPGGLPVSIGSLPSFNSAPSGGAAYGGIPDPRSCRPSMEGMAPPATFGAVPPSLLRASLGSAGRLSNNSQACSTPATSSHRNSEESMQNVQYGTLRPSMDGGSAGRTGSSPDLLSSNQEGASLPPGAELDLAQSLATLKIALTQQHVAAANGSNHEIVISTLHQILKDAIAQHGGTLPQLGLPGLQHPPSLGSSPPQHIYHAATSAPQAPMGAHAEGGLTPAALAAASSFYTSAGAAGQGACAVASNATDLGGGRYSAGAKSAQQGWVSTMGPLRWDAPPHSHARTPNSPSSIALMAQDERRGSAESTATDA